MTLRTREGVLTNARRMKKRRRKRKTGKGTPAHVHQVSNFYLITKHARKFIHVTERIMEVALVSVTRTVRKPSVAVTMDLSCLLTK